MRRLLAGLAAAVTLSLAACSSTATPAPTGSSPVLSSVIDPTPTANSTTSSSAASTVTDSTPTTGATQADSGGSAVTITPAPSDAPTTPPITTPSNSPTDTTASSATSTSPTGTSKATPPTSSPSVTVTIPATITGANRKAAKAGIAAWRNSMHVFDLSLQDPSGKNWGPAIRKSTGDPAAAQQIQLIKTFDEHKIHQVGFTHYDATVTKASTKNVQIRACVDITGMDVVDANGQSDIQPDEAKRFYRTFSVTWYTTKRGGWLLNHISTPNPAQPC